MITRPDTLSFELSGAILVPNVMCVFAISGPERTKHTWLGGTQWKRGEMWQEHKAAYNSCVHTLEASRQFSKEEILATVPLCV